MNGTLEVLKTGAERVREWSKSPSSISEAEHSEFCNNGFVAGDVLSYYEVDRNLTCPICANKRKIQERHEQSEKDIQASGIGSRYYQIEFSDLEIIPPIDRIKTACENIAKIIKEGHSASFWGNPGTGKTQSAVMSVKSAIRAGFTAGMVNIGRLSMDIRQGYSDGSTLEAETVRRLSSVDLLVFDDIGAGETGAATVEQRVLYLVLESRQNTRKPTIITTNLNPPELIASVGQRIINRLQPLSQIHFNHTKNFRAPTDTKGMW
jgi:DNA replication protein DnaC